MELNRLLEIAADRETCDFCPDCDDINACMQCKKVKPISCDELSEYHAAVKAALCRTAEDDCSECIVTSGAHEASGKHIRDLLAAEDEGRLVVLPCKVGYTVYEPYGDHAKQWKVEAFEIGEDLEPRPGYYVPYEGFFAHTFKEGEIFTVYLTSEAARAALGGGEGG